MKEQLLLPIIALMCVLLAFTLMSCKADLNGESTTEISADNKQDCFQLIDQFFEDVFKDANVVVTFKIDDDIWFTENIKGTTSNVLFHDTEVKSYFKEQHKKGSFGDSKKYSSLVFGKFDPDEHSPNESLQQLVDICLK
jgi:hypothetical protein